MKEIYALIINGYPRSGKDTFSTYLHKAWGRDCVEISTVDFPKEIAYHLGWNGDKTPRMREFLSKQKDLLEEYLGLTNVLVGRTVKRMGENLQGHGLLIIHCREPERIKELEKMLLRMNVASMKVLVDRDVAKERALKEQNNHADLSVGKMEVDYLVKNNGTLEELQDEAVELVTHLKERLG